MTSKPSTTNSPKAFAKQDSQFDILAAMFSTCLVSFSPICHHIKVVIVAGFHLFPFRTEKLSPPAPMVLHTRGRVGSRRFQEEESFQSQDWRDFYYEVIFKVIRL